MRDFHDISNTADNIVSSVVFEYPFLQFDIAQCKVLEDNHWKMTTLYFLYPGLEDRTIVRFISCSSTIQYQGYEIHYPFNSFKQLGKEKLAYTGNRFDSNNSFIHSYEIYYNHNNMISKEIRDDGITTYYYPSYPIPQDIKQLTLDKNFPQIVCWSMKSNYRHFYVTLSNEDKKKERKRVDEITHSMHT